MSFLCRILVTGACAGALLSLAPRFGHAGGIGITTEEGPRDSVVVQAVEKPFHHFKLSQDIWPKAHRDLEFFWSDTYDTLGRPLVPPDSLNNNELVRMGRLVCQDPGNPLGFDRTDIQIVYDYLNARIPDRVSKIRYSVDYVDSAGFYVRAAYDSLNRSHIDAYVYRPITSSDPAAGHYDPVYGSRPGDYTLDNRHQFPSAFVALGEDTLQGRPRGGALQDNSIMMPGPIPGKVIGGMPTGWAVPDASSGFMHEFCHAINDLRSNASAMNELRGSCAEALVGVVPGGPISTDVPYTWSLLHFGDPSNRNYQAWRSFSSYLAYNFRGTDESAAGYSEDLLARWAALDTGDGLTLAQLGGQLTDATCAECADLDYFEDISSGHDRLQVLIHNWRVANYANDTAMAEGQYGFPPRFGFIPWRDVGNWRRLNGSISDDVHAIPPEITVRSPETVLDVERNSANCAGCRLPMLLRALGAEYWVINADEALATSEQDLVLRLTPEGPLCTSERDARLMMSAILYSGRTDTLNTLWRHPELASAVIGPEWIDVGNSSAPDTVLLTVPEFGSEGGPQAVVVVISLGDGPLGYYSDLSSLWDDNPILPYALRLSLHQDVACDAGHRELLTTESDYSANFPSWSPAGDQIVYQASTSFGSEARIYRQPLAGGSRSLVASPPASYIKQFAPDWFAEWRLGGVLRGPRLHPGRMHCQRADRPAAPAHPL